MQACDRIVKQATCPARAGTVSAVSRTVADPQAKNCAEQIYNSHPLGGIRALGKGPRLMHAMFLSLNSPKQGAMKGRIHVLHPAKQFKSNNELVVDSQQRWSEKGI